MIKHPLDRTRPLRPSWLRGRLAKWSLLPYRMGLGTLMAPWFMVLTTRGRVTGMARKAPLWYVRQGNIVYCLSGWGSSSDWLKNLKANPSALVKIGKERWETRGELIQDPQEGERVLSMFLKKYGRLVRVFYHMDRLELVAYPLGVPGALPSTRPSYS